MYPLHRLSTHSKASHNKTKIQKSMVFTMMSIIVIASIYTRILWQWTFKMPPPTEINVALCSIQDIPTSPQKELEKNKNHLDNNIMCY